MEELSEVIETRRVAFKSKCLLPTQTNGKLKSWKIIHQIPSHNSSSSSEYLQIPNNATEYLCRSWTPSASNFLHLFPNNPHSALNEEIYCLEEQEDKLDDSYSTSDVQDQKLPKDETNGSAPQSNQLALCKTQLKKAKKWLKNSSLPTLLRRHRMERKEEIRLHTANVHAALSVTRLAAVIVGFATRTIGVKDASLINSTVEGDKKMDNIVATAAVLVARVCAEAAEAVGAHRTQVSTAISSGLATQTPADVVTLTAAAATCLRGAATLKSRAKDSKHCTKNEELLKGIQLFVVTPSGHRRLRWVSIYTKHRQIFLRFERKYLRVIPAFREYMILEEKEIKEDVDNHSVTLKTNQGDVELHFEDKNQLLIWKANISNLLQL